MNVVAFLTVIVVVCILLLAVIIWSFPFLIRFYGWLFDLLFPTHYEYDEYDDDDYEYF